MKLLHIIPTRTMLPTLAHCSQFILLEAKHLTLSYTGSKYGSSQQ